MSDVPTSSVAPAPQPPAPPAGKAGNLPGLLALIFAVVGFVLGVIPPTSGLAWLLLVPAIVLGIVGLTRKGRPKALALAGLIVGVVGLIVAIIVAAVTFFAAVGDAVGDALADSAPTSASSADAGSSAAPDDKKEAKIGDTVTNSDGVAFTVSSIQCGIAHAGDQYFGEDAKGQFCEVKYTVKNGGDKKIDLLSDDLTGYIGSAEYDVDGSTISTFGGDAISTSVNPGLSADCDVFIDIPADQALDYVKFKPAFSFTGGVVVSAK